MNHKVIITSTFFSANKLKWFRFATHEEEKNHVTRDQVSSYLLLFLAVSHFRLFIGLFLCTGKHGHRGHMFSEVGVTSAFCTHYLPVYLKHDI